MLRYLLGLSVPLLFLALVESYILKNMNVVYGWRSIEVVLYVCLALWGYVGLILATKHWKNPPINRHSWTNFSVGFGMVMIVLKIVIAIGLLLVLIIGTIASLFISNLSMTILVQLVFLSCFLALILLCYGLIWGKYNFQLEEVELSFDDLPESFDNFKIVQISDAHSGTWDSYEGVEKGIKLIESQHPDLIVFTGDLVNSNKDEINPFMDLFQRLDAPFGKYAILGNHDYYGQPRDRDMRPAYFEKFFDKYKEMGFDLILNDSRIIEKNGQNIYLLGVENWGLGRYFPKRGNLDKATANITNSAFSILLSHDPSHWDIKALSHPQHFHLTLSGHTHGMQFGINLPFFKWSPIRFRYKRWMGLYQEKSQYLYVNRGFGVLVYPGRVGMSPEVTLINLKKS